MGVVSILPKSDSMKGFLAPILGRVAPTESFSIPGDVSDQSRVLVIDSGELTEILFFSPIINYLKTTYPGMRLTMLVREGNSELVRSMTQVSEMISYEPNHLSLSSTTFLSLLKRIRSRDFNVAFLLGTEFNMPRALLAILGGAKIRVGYSATNSFPYVNCEVRMNDTSSYEGTRFDSFLTVLGLQPADPLPVWQLPDQDVRWAKQLVHFHKPEKDTKLIAVDPGLGKGSHRLVDESFTYLINQLAMRMPSKVLVLSNNLDQKRIDQFKAKIKNSLIDIEPKNAKEGIALLSCADLFLSGNTDFFHFAVSMRTPTVGLFTRHDSPNWFPKGTPWVQILQGVKGQRLSLDEFNSKIDTLLHFTGVE
ncbi:MAG: glycosyltransferase family 9 protein [Candidatus Latescibacterota bacterium]|nr:MAG: glycosyltransferase family 9 protein [Candidatus Latescibacterota bacterium]